MEALVKYDLALKIRSGGILETHQAEGQTLEDCFKKIYLIEKDLPPWILPDGGDVIVEDAYKWKYIRWKIDNDYWDREDRYGQHERNEIHRLFDEPDKKIPKNYYHTNLR